MPFATATVSRPAAARPPRTRVDAASTPRPRRVRARAALALAQPPRGAAPPRADADVSLPTSVWELKPVWCQPWSIVATGVGAVWLAAWTGGSFYGSAAAAAVAVWWYMFLYLMPSSYADYVEQVERRRRD